MNFIRKLFASEPPPPPEPVDSARLQSVRADIIAFLAAVRQRFLEHLRRERERQRRLEEERRRREAETPPSSQGETAPRFSVFSSPGIRYQISGARTDIISGLDGYDPRAFARRVVQGVATVYGGNPVPFYTAAGISRSAYSKLISFPDRHPAKDTVLAMAAALKMDAPSAESFLRLAGYAFSDALPADIVWHACFAHGVHYLPQIRELLDEFVPRTPSSSP